MSHTSIARAQAPLRALPPSLFALVCRKLIGADQKEAPVVDHLIGSLLQDAVNTSCKLTLVLLYAEHERFVATTQQLATRLGRDPWSIDEAARELADAGILSVHENRVTFNPASRHHEAVRQLRACYNDPMQRADILSTVHELEQYAKYRLEFGKVQAVAA